MANSTEKHLVEKLQSENTSEVQEALLRIRKHYIRNQHRMKKLQKYPLIESIIPFLEHPKFCITSLSIIMEGCVQSNFANDVIKYHGVESLMRIMRSCVNEVIQSKACRALGNIAKFNAGYKVVHHYKPISNIIQFLSETNDAICQKTAVRTLKILGKSSKNRELIARENGIVYIAKLLHSSNIDVLICSIEALANLTQNCSIFCARQLLEQEFFEVFIKLCSHSEIRVRNNALILLQNLSTQEEIRSNLVKAGAVKLFTNIISDKSDEMIPTVALSLCKFLDHLHMWSHNGIDRALGLKALVLVLQNRKYEGIHRRIITSLIPLSYESKVSDILLSLNLLPVLTQILKDFIEENKCETVTKVLLKLDCNTECDVYLSEGKRVRKYENPKIGFTLDFKPVFAKMSGEEIKSDPQSDKNCSISSNVDDTVTFKKSGLSSHTNSDYSLLTKSFEKYGKLVTKDKNNCALNLNSKVGGEVSADSALRVHLELSKSIYHNYKSTAQQLNNYPELQTIDHCTLLFILQLSFHLGKNPNSQIADKNCFSVIIDYLCFIHNPSNKAETVLLNLIQNRYCFEKLIVRGFISELADKLGHITFCSSAAYYQTTASVCCHHPDVKVMYSKLIQAGRQEAESDFGVGTLSHILATSGKTEQLYAICAVAKLVTEKSALYRLLFQANGLPLLLRFLSDSSSVTRVKAVISVCEIYQSLTKEQEKETCCIQTTSRAKYSTFCCYESSSFDVTFSVINGKKVLANREKLCENSEYFNALLSGHFLESKADVITLPNISAENLTFIFHFLHGCGIKACCPYISCIPLSALLELLSHCEQFLLINMKTIVEDRLRNSLCASKVPIIYKYSKIHNSPALTRRSLNFALGLNILKREALFECFEELLRLDSSLNFLGDIESLLISIF